VIELAEPVAHCKVPRLPSGTIVVAGMPWGGDACGTPL
jgi:hypothetical protein